MKSFKLQFYDVFLSRPRPEKKKKKKKKKKTSGWGSLYFLCWSIDVFVSFLVFVSRLENNLLRDWKTIFCALAFVESSASATSESTTNYSSSCSASFSPLFPSERTAVNTAAAVHFLLVTMNTRSKTDEKERIRQRGWRRQGVCRESRPYFSFEFRFRIMFSYFFPFQFEIKQCAILLPWKLFLSNESRSFCTRLFLFRFINRNRNTAQKEYALNVAVPTL